MRPFAISFILRVYEVLASHTLRQCMRSLLSLSARKTQMLIEIMPRQIPVVRNVGKWNDHGSAENRECGGKQQGDLEVVQFQVSLHQRNQQTEAMHHGFPGKVSDCFSAHFFSVTGTGESGRTCRTLRRYGVRRGVPSSATSRIMCATPSPRQGMIPGIHAARQGELIVTFASCPVAPVIV